MEQSSFASTACGQSSRPFSAGCHLENAANKLHSDFCQLTLSSHEATKTTPFLSVHCVQPRQRSVSESVLFTPRKGILKRRMHCSLSECESCFDITGKLRDGSEEDVCHNFELSAKKTVRFSESVERREYPPPVCEKKKKLKSSNGVNAQTDRLESFSEEEDEEEKDDLNNQNKINSIQSQSSPPTSGRFQCFPVIEEDIKVVRINASTTKVPMKSRFQVVRVAEVVDT